MPYNLGMNQITLALPFALPPPEMAADLFRVMKTPALAALLSRHNRRDAFRFDSANRVLPHEAWIAHALGLAPAPDSKAADAPLATSVMRGSGHAGAAADGYWLMLQPAHIQISRTHLLMSDSRQLQLDYADARALFDTAQPLFGELGLTLLYGGADLWFLRADGWSGLRTASPDAAIGQNLTDWMPEGERARDFRKLQNEVQMLWHEHPANQARQARGLSVINSFWLWGGAAGSAQANGNFPLLAISGGPAWMAALARQELHQPSAGQLLAQAEAGHAIAVLAELIPDGMAGDWAAWLHQLQRIEQEWFAPLLAALGDGRLKQLTLVLSDRDGWTEISSTKLAQRKFWRKPALNNLLNRY